MAYTKKYLESLDRKKRFLLDKDVLLEGAPELLSGRKFAEIFHVDPMFITRANQKGLLVMEKNSHQVMRVNVRKSLDKMAAAFEPEVLKLEEKTLDNAFRTDRGLTTMTKNPKDFVKVEVGPQTLVMDRLLPATSEEEMAKLQKKWTQLTGQEKMPELNKHQISKLLWHKRYMHVTNMLLDAHAPVEITTMMMSDWGMTWNQSKRIITLVEKDIIKSIEKRKNFLVSQAYLRYEKLFNEAMKDKDIRTATVINKEIINLYGIDKMAAELLESKASEEDGHMSILAQIGS